MPTLDWVGKKAVENHHNQVPFHLLKEDTNLTLNGSENGNLLVEGDNLLALKALLPYYAGQVKCIYIDPPYNTGNENWVYNDNVNSPEIRKWLGKVVGSEMEDLTRHDKWLCMMYPRIRLLKDFLREDGSIWISMDDSEIKYLRFIMDDIFGEDHFIACNIWQKRYSRENREAIGDVHEYILVNAVNPDLFKKNRRKIAPDEKQKQVYKNKNNDPKGPRRTVPMTAQGYRINQMYDIITPAGIVHKPPEGRCWSITEIEYKKLLEKDLVYFGKEKKSQPSIIRYLSEVDGFVPWTWWPHTEVGHTDEAKKEIRELFGTQTAFDTPKPTRLIKRILEISSHSDDIILDSFSGSGTTGHAVLQLNKEDKGNRRFILVEMDSNICKNVTSERLKRVAKGYTEPGGQKIDGLGGGFSYCKLGPVCFDEHGRINPEVSYDELARYVFFSETGVPLPKKKKHSGPLVGVHNGSAIYLLYNGVLKDTGENSGNVLTRTVLGLLTEHQGPKVVYGTACRLSTSRLRTENIIFRQIPYEIRVK